MAKDTQKIFDFIRKLIAGSGPPPTTTAICKALIAERLVGSTGTAHRYVRAFFAADSMKAEFRAPESDASQLPERVAAAFEALVSAANVLRNEAVAAFDDQVMQSSTNFGLMAAAHSTALQDEVDELGNELQAMRSQVEALRQQVADEEQRRVAAEATLAAQESRASEATRELERVTNSLATEQGRLASLQAALEAKDEVIEALQSERAMRARRDEQTDQQIESLRSEIDRLSSEREGRIETGDARRPTTKLDRSVTAGAD